MTPAIAHLEKHHIEHRVHRYEHDPSAASYGLEAAEKLSSSGHVPPQAVFKTLVVHTSDSTLAVAIVPVEKQLSLKHMASALNVKKVKLAPADAVTRSTGYQLGGVSPIGQKTALTTVVDLSATHLPKLFVSAGKRGLEVALTPQDLISVCKATIAEIAA